MRLSGGIPPPGGGGAGPEAGVLNVVLVGFKGAGKSTLGPALARALGWAFDDLDRRLARRAGEELGGEVSFREAFRRLGEDRFRRLEQELLAAALAEERLVLALGGGAALGPAAGDLLAGHCVVYVRAPAGDLVRRVRAGGWPAYLDGAPDPEAALRRLLAERLPRYEAMADVVVDNPDGTGPEEAAARAAEAVRRWMAAG